MSASARPFRQTVGSIEELRDLYRGPSLLVKAKVKPELDAASRAYIGRSPFVLLGTQGPDGLDVSPRGGAPGFIKVLDESRLAVPDLSGNNLLDTISNVVRDGRLGMQFLVPGKDETLRVNGRAWVTTDDAVLDLFVDDVKRPKVAIGVEVPQLFTHCARAFRRSRLWDPESWPALADAPDGAEILLCQKVVEGVRADVVRADLERSYARDLE